VSAATALITLVTSFFVSKRKQKTDNFESFMEQSAEYREELRKEIKRKEEDFEKELKERDERIKELVENEKARIRNAGILNTIPQMVWMTDEAGKTIYYNTRWHEYTGMPLEASIGNGWQTVLHPEDSAAVIKAWNASFSTFVPYDICARMRRGNGEYRWFLIRGVPFMTNGHVTQWVGTCTDIHELLRSKMVD
jgi:PAS domain S-box-containing protein